MNFLAHIPVSAFGMLVAASCVVAGAPLFAHGLRAHRLRSLLDALVDQPLDRDAAGCVQVHGMVSLEGPLFAPVSGKPCAGFELEVRAASGHVGGSVRELRPFRLNAGETSARVIPEHARWQVAVSGERTLAAGEPLSARLAELLDSCVELRWLRDRRATLHIAERALEVGANVWVLGMARSVAVAQAVEVTPLAATGTDGPIVDHTPPAMTTSTCPEVWIEADAPLGCVVVSNERPSVAALRPRAWRQGFAILGPLLTVCGLLYLALAVAPLLSGRLS